jgi:hypothetical protein
MKRSRTPRTASQSRGRAVGEHAGTSSVRPRRGSSGSSSFDTTAPIRSATFGRIARPRRPVRSGSVRTVPAGPGRCLRPVPRRRSVSTSHFPLQAAQAPADSSQRRLVHGSLPVLWAGVPSTSPPQSRRRRRWCWADTSLETPASRNIPVAAPSRGHHSHRLHQSLAGLLLRDGPRGRSGGPRRKKLGPPSAEWLE